MPVPLGYKLGRFTASIKSALSTLDVATDMHRFGRWKTFDATPSDPPCDRHLSQISTSTSRSRWIWTTLIFTSMKSPGNTGVMLPGKLAGFRRTPGAAVSYALKAEQVCRQRMPNHQLKGQFPRRGKLVFFSDPINPVSGHVKPLANPANAKKFNDLRGRIELFLHHAQIIRGK